MTRSAFATVIASALGITAVAGTAIAGDSTSSAEFFFSGIPHGSSSVGTVSRSLARSNTQQPLVVTNYNSRPMGVTVHGGQLYWASYSPGEIWRSDLSGNNQVRLATTGPDSYTRHIVAHQGMLYWNEEGTGVIKRANMDGSNPQVVISGYTGYNAGIWDFVIAGDRFYWTSWISGDVSTTNLDGSDYRRFQVGTERAVSIDTDGTSLLIGNISDRSHSTNPHRVWHVSLDGQQQDLLAEIPLASNSSLEAVSVFDGRAYYAWSLGGTSQVSNVSSVPLNGGPSTLEMSITNQVQIWQLDVIPAPSVSGLLVPLGVWSARRSRRRV